MEKESFELQEVYLGVRRRHKPNRRIFSSCSVAQFVREQIPYEHHYLKEYSYVMYLDHACNALAFLPLGVGNTNSCILCVKEVMQGALLVNASSFITVHNHPAGTLKPSDNDLALWKTLYKAAQIFGIKNLDNLIITHPKGYYSHADELSYTEL